MSSILLLLVVARKNSNGTIEKINGMVSQIIPAKVGNFGSLLDKEERKFRRVLVVEIFHEVVEGRDTG